MQLGNFSYRSTPLTILHSLSSSPLKRVHRSLGITCTTVTLNKNGFVNWCTSSCFICKSLFTRKRDRIKRDDVYLILKNKPLFSPYPNQVIFFFWAFFSHLQLISNFFSFLHKNGSKEMYNACSLKHLK